MPCFTYRLSALFSLQFRLACKNCIHDFSFKTICLIWNYCWRMMLRDHHLIEIVKFHSLFVVVAVVALHLNHFDITLHCIALVSFLFSWYEIACARVRWTYIFSLLFLDMLFFITVWDWWHLIADEKKLLSNDILSICIQVTCALCIVFTIWFSIFSCVYSGSFCGGRIHFLIMSTNAHEMEFSNCVFVLKDVNVMAQYKSIFVNKTHFCFRSEYHFQR